MKAARLVAAPGYWPALRSKVVPSLEHANVGFSKAATVLDIGASRGQFATFAARRFPEARIVCFEPLPAPREALKRITPPDRTEIHGIALGSERSERIMHVSQRDDSSSLLPIGERQVRAFPDTAEAGTMPVSVGVLADYLPADIARPCLVKIDVQGTELDVLRGGGDALARVDEIYVECSFLELYTGQALADEVICELHGHGFRLTAFHNVVRATNHEFLQADLLFKRSVGKGRLASQARATG